MTMIRLFCRGTVARAQVEGQLTHAMVGVRAEIQWDEAWDGLVKTLKVRCAEVCRTAVVSEAGTVVTPYECLIAGQRLEIGLDGWDADGTLRIPSSWASCGVVKPSVAQCDGPEGAPPTVDTLVELKRIVTKAEAAADKSEQSVKEVTDSKNAAAGSASAAAGSAGAAAGSAAAANQSAQAAREALEKTQAISVNPSYIGASGNWFVWDTARDSYVDSGVPAQGPKGDPGAVQRVCGVAPDAAGNVALTAENVGAATPEQLNAAVRKAAPRNLLDNSDFRNPVNQRGQTSYAGNGGLVYAIDRWLTYSAYMTVSVQDGYLSITNNSESEYAQFSQIVSGLNVIGKTVTVAAWDTNGRISCASGVMSEDWIVSVGNDYNIFCHTIENNCIIFSIAPKAYKTANILGVALYEGTYTAETLPEYQPKGYGAELAECQRYYQIRSTNNIAAVDMRPTMRLSSPTITSVTGGYAYSADL